MINFGKGNTMNLSEEKEEPSYVISVAARMLGVHAQTLRYYERVGIISPQRSPGNIRLYSAKDIDRLRQVKTLMSNLGVNLAGVEVILRLAQRIAEMDRVLKVLTEEVESLKPRKFLLTKPRSEE